MQIGPISSIKLPLIAKKLRKISQVTGKMHSDIVYNQAYITKTAEVIETHILRSLTKAHTFCHSQSYT